MTGQAQPQSAGPKLGPRDEQKSCGSSSLSLSLCLFPPFFQFLEAFISQDLEVRPAQPAPHITPHHPTSPCTAALIAHAVHFKYLRLHGKHLYAF